MVVLSVGMQQQTTSTVSLDELLRKRGTALMDAPARHPARHPVSQQILRPGVIVRVHSLKSAPQLNGQHGTCEQWSEDTGRWRIRIANGETKALKPENLSFERDDTEPKSEQRNSAWQERLRKGVAVQVVGLTPDMNGMRGTCEAWDDDSGRWEVTLSNGSWRALKPENLEIFKEPVLVLCPGVRIRICGLGDELDGMEGVCEEWDADSGRWEVTLSNKKWRALKKENLEVIGNIPSAGQKRTHTQAMS